MAMLSTLLCMLVFTGLNKAFTIPHSDQVQVSIEQEALTNDFRIPTVHESAVEARRILSLEDIGTLSTTFPSNPVTAEHRPDTVNGLAFGSMDYFADCEPSSGNPTILQLDIGTSFKNVRDGSNITLSVRWHPPGWKTYSAVAQPRFSLVGYLEEMNGKEIEDNGVELCYMQYHPDAVAWFPGNAIHTSRWVRLVVKEIYWIGGFGDRAYIGWIPLDIWRNVTSKEIEDCTLPGESKHLFP